MKSSLKLFCILLVSAGLILPACKKQEEAAPEENVEATEEEGALEEEGTAEEEVPEVAPEEEVAPEGDAAAEGDATGEENAEEADATAAEGDATEGAEKAEGDKKEEAKKAPAKPKGPALTGRLSGTVGAVGVTNGKLDLNIKSDYSVNGTYTGTSEGKPFRVPFKGTINKNTNTLSATGKSGNSALRLTGNVKSKAVSGTINGTIHGKNLQRGASYTLTK